METTVCNGLYIGVIVGDIRAIYWDKGKSDGNYSLGFRVRYSGAAWVYRGEARNDPGFVGMM